jgi:hypothetical protein
MQPGFSEELERASALADEVRLEWLQRPGVMAVGSGMERRRGRPTGRAAIVVVVERKMSAFQLRQQ